MGFAPRKIFASFYEGEKPKFFFWYPPGTSKAEKKLLHKIDFFILSYACLNFFIKYLDQSNLSNAYVSGMKEELKMYGNQLNLCNTLFQIGSILGSIFSNLIITRVSPRYWLPGCELLWGLLTLGTYAIKTYTQVRKWRWYPIFTINHLSNGRKMLTTVSYIQFAFSWGFWRAQLLLVFIMVRRQTSLRCQFFQNIDFQQC